MPITRRQFELGIDEKNLKEMKRIHAFLAEHREKVYTEAELQRTVGLDAEELARLLKALEDIGVVESRPVRGNWYFTYRADFLAV